jgi:hypothetical protein
MRPGEAVRCGAGRSWGALGAHPLTLVGLTLGFALVLLLGTFERHTRHQVHSIERRVILIEHRQRTSPAIHVCTSSDPGSLACRELRRLLRDTRRP